MTKDKCVLNLNGRQETLINPILDYFTILEKINVKVIYNPFFRKNFVIKKRFGTYPIYLPEIGYMLSMETVSPALSKRFYKETKEYERFYSDEKIIFSKIYNFNKELNRIVSWGHFSSFRIPSKYYKLYISNLTNDFLFMPSIVRKFGLISPNRWFRLDSRDLYYFSAIINYNVGIVYLERRLLEKAKKTSIWVNSPLDVYETQAGFIKLNDEGKVFYKDRIFIHFLNDPLEELKFGAEKDYFICFLVSLNEYETSYPKFVHKNRKFNINLIENLTDIIYSPYEIIPFLFPSILNSIDTNKLVFNFSIKKSCINSIIKRMTKFASEQHINLIKTYDQLFETRNKLFKIEEKNENEFNVKLINPTVIPFLIRNYKINNERHAKSLLESPNIIEDLEDIEKSSYSFKWIPLRGIGNVLNIRKNLLLQYSRILGYSSLETFNRKRFINL